LKSNAASTRVRIDSSSVAEGLSTIHEPLLRTALASRDDGNGEESMNFPVRDAGEVEIERDGDRLILIGARPNPGWELEAEDEEDDEDEDDEEEEEDEELEEGDEDDEEIEVTFVQGDREVEFEAEIDDGRLAIEIEETWHGVEAGSYTVADAGEVEIRRDGDRLIMVGVIANEGWDFEVEHEDGEDDSGDTVEVSFVSGDREAEFEAKIEDGVLEVEIETKEYVDEARS
jgi:virulence-associated protein VagC